MARRIFRRWSSHSERSEYVVTATESPKEQVSGFYERHHSRGKYDYLYGDADRKETLLRLIGTKQRTLDIGCRSGNLTQFYCKENVVVGVDVDRKALDMFRERLGLEGHWCDVDAEPLPFADSSFDLVVFTEVMEHVRFPAKALAEIRRVLKPEGRLVGSVPNAFRLRNRWRFLWGQPFETDPSHLRSYSARILHDTLAALFLDIEILPVSGHLLGGGKRGVRVFGWLPHRVRCLFCLDLVFHCSGTRKI